MRPHVRVREFATASPSRTALLLGALLGLVGVAKYGLSMWPGWVNLHQVALNWQDPTVGSLVQPPQDYILSNSLVALLCGMAGLTSQAVYVTVQVQLSLAAIVVAFTMPVVRESPDRARLLYVMLAGGPILALLLTWIGGYDAVCVIAGTVAVLARWRWVSALGWLLFAVNHSSIALFALVVWAVFLLLGERAPARRAALGRIGIAAVSVAAGAAAMGLVTESWGGVTSRTEVFQLYGLDYYWNAFIAGMPLLAFSALGVGWVVLLDSGYRRTRAARVLLIEAAVVTVTLPLIALDETRTVALVLLPTVLAWAATADRTSAPDMPARAWRRYAVAATIVPVVAVWAGDLLYGGWVSILGWRAGF